jgi:hypothetical protein
MMNEKAFQEVAKSNASLRWQDSVQNFAINRSMNSSIDSLVTVDEPKPSVPKIMTLFLVLLPKGGVKHSPIYTKCVQIKSNDFNGCDDVDFLNLCREIFNESGKLNYIYCQEGQLIERVDQIQDKSILFVKRDPGFNATEIEFNHVIVSVNSISDFFVIIQRTLERE